MKVKKKLFWVTNFLVLALFSVYAASGLLGFGTRAAYADTLESHDFASKSKNFVVVHNDENAGGPRGAALSASSSDDVICSLTPTQAAQLDAFFSVNITSFNVNNNTVQVAVVSGHHLTRSELIAFLRASNQSLDCQVVGAQHVFFMPVLPQIS